MDDLISRKALLKLQFEADEWNQKTGFYDLPVVAVENIETAPSVDAVEVVHGRWEYDFEPIAWCEDYVKVVYTCSVCECRSQDESHYCPNCGAKMDGERREGE